VGGEVGHHGHVFVFEVVAVEDVFAGVAVESDGDGRFFCGAQVDGVFQPASKVPGPLMPRESTWNGFR
jgi:hypothetical protein